MFFAQNSCFPRNDLKLWAKVMGFYSKTLFLDQNSKNEELAKRIGFWETQRWLYPKYFGWLFSKYAGFAAKHSVCFAQYNQHLSASGAYRRVLSLHQPRCDMAADLNGDLAVGTHKNVPTTCDNHSVPWNQREFYSIHHDTHHSRDRRCCSPNADHHNRLTASTLFREK